MKKHLLILLLIASGFLYSQKNNFALDVKGNVLLPMGNNFIKDGLKPFKGFGADFQGVFYKGLGVGVEFNKFYTEVKDQSIFGALKSPNLTDFSIYLLYQYSINKKFETEAQLGISQMRLRSVSDYRQSDFKENAHSNFIGAKLLYDISDKKRIQVFLSPKIYFFHSDVHLDNAEAQKYYSKSTLLNLGLGVRFNF